MTLEEEIRELEREITGTQKNKSTEHHLGRIKAKIARLREEQEKQARKARKTAGVKKAGDATVVLVGPTGSGRSTMLARLTGARPSDDPLATTPGIIAYKGAKIQVLDIPDLLLTRDALNTIKSSDLALLVIDPGQPDPAPYLDILYSHGIRINQSPPDVLIKKTARGGITINSTVDPGIERSSIESILHEYKIHSADVLIRETLTQDRFIDALEERKYLCAMTVMNKADLLEDASSGKLPGSGILLVSALTGSGIDLLKDEIFGSLDLIRIYNKPQGGQPDMDEPMILRSGSTVGDLCDRIHKDFRKRFRYASIWGASAKYAGQREGLDHLLADGDIITIVIEK